MSHLIKGDTAGIALQLAIRNHLNHPTPDVVCNIETHLFNSVIQASSCEMDLDLGKHLWLNRQRWSRLIKEYVPAEPLARFVLQAKEIIEGNSRNGATANMLFRDPNRSLKKHRWGGCLMGMVFRGSFDERKKRGPTHAPEITLYSRTTYIGYMGLLDAAIVNRVSALINEPVNIRFRWFMASQQFPCFKSLPVIYSQPDLMKRLEQLTRRKEICRDIPPTWYHMAKWFRGVLNAYNQYGVKMLDHERYGPLRRIKRRWLEYRGLINKNVPPSCPIETLTFEKAI